MKKVSMALSTYFLLLTVGNAAILQNLEYIPLDGSADIRTRSNELYVGCESVRVTKTRVTCWIHARRVDLGRSDILRVIVNGKVYSDFVSSASADGEQNLPPTSAASEIDQLADCRKKISDSIFQAAIQARARNCPQVLEFADILDWPVNFFLIVSTPANFFPSTGLALGSNFFAAVNFGLSVGGSGPYITAGIYYAQAHLYWNIRLSPANYVGFKLGFRSIDISSPATSRATSADSPNYFSAFTRAKITQFTIPIYYGWQFTPQDSMELGIDIGIRTRSSVSFDDHYLSDAARINPALQPEIQQAVGKASETLATYEKVTWVYAAYVHRF